MANLRAMEVSDRFTFVSSMEVLAGEISYSHSHADTADKAGSSQHAVVDGSSLQRRSDEKDACS